MLQPRREVAGYKRRMRRPVAWLAVAGTLIAVVFVASNRRQSSSGSIPTAPVQRGMLQIEVTTVGEVQAVHSTALSVPRLKSNRVKIVDLVPEGAHVAAGDTLALFDTSDVLRRIEELESQLRSARANLEKLRATQAARRAELRAAMEDQHAAVRLAELNAANVSYEARVEQEKADLTLNRARLQLQQLESKIEAQRTIDEAERTEQQVKIEGLASQLSSEQEALANHVLVAPTGGLVVYGRHWVSRRRAKVQVGDEVHYGIVVVELPDLSQLRVTSYLNEARVSQIDVGDVCTIQVDAFPDTTYTGRIESINVLGRNLPDVAGVKVFDYEVLLDGNDRRLRPGMTASVVVHVDEIDDVLLAPIESVHSDEEGFFVYRRAGRDFERCRVSLGPQNEFHVALTSGVAAGDQLALRAPTADTHDE